MVADGTGERREAHAPAGPEPTDQSLLRRLRGGDQEAATQIYVRYANRLEALARKNRSADLAGRVDAEDIVQSVFRIFFRHASRGHYDVPAGEDLWKLLLVLALNKIRSERIYHRAAKRDARLTTAVTGHAKILSAPSSQDNLATACLRIVVDEALGRLTPQQRTVVELRIDGHEVSEIAAKTNRSKRTVERLLQESRRKLRDLLPDGG